MRVGRTLETQLLCRIKSADNDKDHQQGSRKSIADLYPGKQNAAVYRQRSLFVLISSNLHNLLDKHRNLIIPTRFQLSGITALWFLLHISENLFPFCRFLSLLKLMQSCVYNMKTAPGSILILLRQPPKTCFRYFSTSFMSI